MARDPVRPVLWWSVAVLAILKMASSADRTYEMDQRATCGQDITVFDDDVVLHARSNATAANPALSCVVYVKSGYTEANGRYRLQITIDAINIRDCGVHVDIFNGKGVNGSYLRSLGCNSMNTDTLYTTGSDATVRFTRPSLIYQTAYDFTLRVRTWQCLDGYFGSGCSSKCGRCVLGDVCNKTTGDCPGECEAGWTGSTCIDLCPDGSFGLECSSKCGRCVSGDVCNKTTGSCLGGCEVGWRNHDCSEISSSDASIPLTATITPYIVLAILIVVS